MRVLLEPVLVAAGVDIVLTGARARPLQEGRHPPPTVVLHHFDVFGDVGYSLVGS